MPIHKTYEAATFDLSKMLLPLTHIFATEPQKALTANTMNVCSEGF